MLEASIEQKCRRYAVACRCLLLKLQGTKGYPDRVLLLPTGRAIFIEFKQFNKPATPLQEFMLQTLQAMQFEAYIVDNFPMFKRLLDERLSTA